MNTLRSLILLFLMSALASAANAHASNAVDGYLDQAQTQQSLLSNQDLEGDEPDAVSINQAKALTRIPSQTYASLVGSYARANYADFLARAPPLNL